MKHIIILGDGMADHPVERLGGKTLLQYADTPYMDLLARKGKTGRLMTIPDGFHPGVKLPIHLSLAMILIRYMKEEDH